MATKTGIGPAEPSQMRSDIQNQSLDFSDEETQQPLPALSPTQAAVKSKPNGSGSAAGLPLRKVSLPVATAPEEYATPAADEKNLQESERSEESVLFSHPHAQAPESEPRHSPTWAVAARLEDEEVPPTIDEVNKEDVAADHHELNNQHSSSAVSNVPPTATPVSSKDGYGAVAGDASDAPPSVSTQTSPRDTTPPSHSEAEEVPDDEAESVSSPHSSHHGDSPPLFSPRTPSKTKQPAAGTGSPLAPLSGLRLPNLSSQTRDSHTTTPTKLASSVASPFRTREAPVSRLPPLTANGSSARSFRRTSREPSPGSSDFGADMNPKYRGAKAFGNIVQSSRSAIRDMSPDRQSDDDPMDSVNPVESSGGSSFPPLEATYIDGLSSSPRGQIRASSVPKLGSSTQINSDPSYMAPESQTQRDDMDVDPAPSVSEDRRLARLAPMSEDGAVGSAGDVELFGETMNSEPSPHASSPQSQPFSFQATQVLNPALESQSPAKSLPSVNPVRRTTSAVSANSGLPEYRLLKRRDRSSALDAPPVQPRSPSPIGDNEQTYVDSRNETSPSRPDEAAEELPPLLDEDAAMCEQTGSSGQTESSLPTPSAEAAPVNMDVDPPAEAPVLTGIHEIETGSLERDPVARPSPNKYGRKGKDRAPRGSSPASASSSSAPDDPDDNTFQPFPQTQEPSVSPAKRKGTRSATTSPSKPSRGSRASNIVSSGIGTSRSASVTSSRAGSRPSRNKRKVFSPTPSLSGASESSSAPEDLEDNTYRPQKKKSKKQAAKTARKPSKKSRREKSAEPQAQAGPSSERHPGAARGRSSRASSAAVGADAQPDSTQRNPADDPLRVLAFWSNTGEYYVGTVTARNKTGYRVSFDDGFTRTLPEDKLRLLDIRKGETVWSRELPYIAVANYDGQSPSITVRDIVKKNNSSLLVKSLAVSLDDIDARYGDRFVPLIELESRFPVASVTKRSSLASVSEQHEALPEFEGKVFLITGDVGDSVKRKIEAYGGDVATDWESVFTVGVDGYELSVAGAPFLIQNSEVGTTMTPKVMAALAAGVPILSARYVDVAIEGGPVWWRNFLVAAGHSTYLGNYASQDIDDNWGGEGWNAAAARSKRQPLIGKSVLFIEPSAKYDKSKGLKTLVRFCLLALGANVQPAAKVPSSVEEYDLVVVENRDKSIHVPDSMVKSGKLANVVWLKSCLLTGHLLPPSVLSELS